MLSQKVFQSGSIQNRACAEDPVLRIAAELEGSVGKHIYGVGYDQENGAVVDLDDLRNDLPEDGHILFHQIQPGLSRLLARARGDNDHGRVGNIGVVPGPDLHGPGKGQAVADIQRLPLRPGPVHVDEDQLGKNAALHQGKSRGRPHKAAADDSRLSDVFLSHAIISHWSISPDQGIHTMFFVYNQRERPCVPAVFYISLSLIPSFFTLL